MQDRVCFIHLFSTRKQPTSTGDNPLNPLHCSLVSFISQQSPHVVIRLFKLYPGKMLVPALDIDLVWHTSQLSATAYMDSMEARCGRFINHDDKIKKSKLAVGNDETQTLYRIRFGEEYTVCLCWECQAIMSAVEDSSDGDEYFGESPVSGFVKTLADKVLADVQFYRAVESARRRNHVKLPVRPEDKAHSQNWPLDAQ